MSIKNDWEPIYDSVVAADHTGDAIWQTAINVSGKGKAEIHFAGNDPAAYEIRITIDENVLYSGIMCQGGAVQTWRFVQRWNTSAWIEYRVSNIAKIVYLDMSYYNI